MRNYNVVGKFNNGSALFRGYADTNNKGLINIDGIEVIPPEYFEIIGKIDDDFLIGVRKIMENVIRL